MSRWSPSSGPGRRDCGRRRVWPRRVAPHSSRRGAPAAPDQIAAVRRPAPSGRPPTSTASRPAGARLARPCRRAGAADRLPPRYDGVGHRPPIRPASISTVWGPGVTSGSRWTGWCSPPAPWTAPCPPGLDPAGRVHPRVRRRSPSRRRAWRSAGASPSSEPGRSCRWSRINMPRRGDTRRRARRHAARGEGEGGPAPRRPAGDPGQGLVHDGGRPARPAGALRRTGDRGRGRGPGRGPDLGGCPRAPASRSVRCGRRLVRPAQRGASRRSRRVPLRVRACDAAMAAGALARGPVPHPHVYLAARRQRHRLGGCGRFAGRAHALALLADLGRPRDAFGKPARRPSLPAGGVSRRSRAPPIPTRTTSSMELATTRSSCRCEASPPAPCGGPRPSGTPAR